jgi:hypothetical protein
VFYVISHNENLSVVYDETPSLLEAKETVSEGNLILDLKIVTKKQWKEFKAQDKSSYRHSPRIMDQVDLDWDYK